MVHGEHNKSKNSGGFALIILGALMLIIGPQEAIVPKSLSVIVWVGGMLIGGIGFYLKFIKNRVNANKERFIFWGETVRNNGIFWQEERSKN